MNMIMSMWALNYMKKIIFIICLLVLCGCSSNKEIKSTPKNIISPLTEKFSYETGKCLINDLMIEYKVFNRGDELEIINEDDDYYYAENNGIVLAFKKGFIRTEKEDKFVEYIGYTRDGSNLYSDFELTNKINTFSLNDKVLVKDKFLDLLYVEYNGEIGYMLENQVSDEEIIIYVAPKINNTPIESNGSTSDDSSSNDSGSYEPVPSSPDPEPSIPEQSNGDGDDMTLAYYQKERPIQLLSNTNSYKAIVLVDKTVSYITKLNRDDEVNIIKDDADDYVIVVGGRMSKVKKEFIRKENEKAYESWDAYAYGGSIIYENYNREQTKETLKTNDVIRVIDEVDDTYVVQLEDGTIGYMKQSSLSKEEIEIYVPKQVIEEPVYNYDDSDDDSYSGGSSPEPAPASEPEEVWTDAKL